ncbi:ABC transporter permease [Ornithinimicrobium murale]|uniref:ABC transporter permease n=1 Tax=Ornithinimicrobium murale TaxID=1050153 RepID=UPI00192DAA66|nr:ABC transporter permease [Ornithinimicrobium murale]
MTVQLQEQDLGDGAAQTGGTPGRGGAPTPWSRIAALALGVVSLLFVIATAFAWPATNAGPRDVPVAVVAPPAVTEQIGAALAEGAGEGAFDLRPVADRAAAEQAIAGREVYGALVLGPGGGEMLTASAASPAVAQVLGQLAANVPPQVGGPLAVTDTVPLPEDDPRGAGLASAVLPLVIAGILSGAASGLAVSGRGRQLSALALLSGAAGLVLGAVSQLWLGGLAGSYWANSGVLALGVAAVGALALGLVRLIGYAGVGVTAVLMVLLGSTLSGVQSAPEMLPSGWGTLGQLLPPGATGTALRSVAWFDGAGSGPALLVLGSWVVLGLLLLLVPGRSGGNRG